MPLVDLLLLTGAPGAGKSSVLEALGTLLEVDGVEHGAIESEELTRGFPLLANETLAGPLGAVFELHRGEGRRLMLVAFTAESEAQLQIVRRAAAAPRELVVCLSAPAEVLAERIELREPAGWPGREALIAHARELAPLAPSLAGTDVVIDTAGREAAEIAREILAAMRARGLV